MKTAIGTWGALLLGVLAAGCSVKDGGGGAAGAPAAEVANPAPQGPRVLSDFDLDVAQGERGLMLVFIYRGASPLYNPAFMVQVHNQNGGVLSQRQTYSSWRPGERKAVEVSERDGPITWVGLRGGGYTAVAGPAGPEPDKYEEVLCAARWRMHR
jgi:hypothetical protein